MMVNRYVGVRLTVPDYRPYEDVCRLLVWVFGAHLGVTATVVPLDDAGEEGMGERFLFLQKESTHARG